MPMKPLSQSWRDSTTWSFSPAAATCAITRSTSKLSLEAAARELRYGWLTSLAESHKLNAIATGHTLDDQAETVLLKFLRGAGTRGLAGIYPEIAIGTETPDSFQFANVAGSCPAPASFARC